MLSGSSPEGTFYFIECHWDSMSGVTVYMSTNEGVLELVQNAVRLNREDGLLVILDDVGERLEFRDVRVKEINLISGNIVLEKEQ